MDTIHERSSHSAAIEKTGEFYLDRLEDESGVSGTGIVARGFEFPDGTCALWWRDSGSLGVYKSLAKVTEIHGHKGKTRIVSVIK